MAGCRRRALTAALIVLAGACNSGVAPAQEADSLGVHYQTKPIGQITPRVIMPPAGARLPEEQPHPGTQIRRRDWSVQSFHWRSTGLKHYPLYFEDMQLERHGHSLDHLQPIWSTGQFYAQVLAWPYNMGLNPPYCTKYVLGQQRPGDCVVRRWYQIPVNANAVVAQGATWTLIPVIFP